MIDVENELSLLAGKDRLSVEYEHGKNIHDLVIDTKPKSVVEIGTGTGFSTAWILLALNQNQRGTVFTFDSVLRKPYAWKVAGIPDDRVRRFNLRFDCAEKVLPKKIDFVFHDAGHFFEHVESDLKQVLPRLSAKAVICIHDIIYSFDMGEKVKKWFGEMDGWVYEEKKFGCGLGIARRFR